MVRTAEDPETDSVVEVEFRVTDHRYPLVSIPESIGCRAQLEQIVPRAGERYGVFYRITGASLERILDAANERGDIEARPVSASGDGELIEVLVTNSEEHFVVTLTDAGAIPREVWSEGGVAHLVVEVPAVYSATEVIDCFLSVHPTVEVVARRQTDYDVPMFTRRELRGALDERLTPRQREVLRSAYVEGYFEWPREKSGEEVAAELDIAHATFSQHLRVAEHKVLSLLFSETR